MRFNERAKGVGDPIGLGFAASLNRPGGNMTGLASHLPELEAKSFQLLREMVPGLITRGTFREAINALLDEVVRGKVWGREVTARALAEIAA